MSIPEFNDLFRDSDPQGILELLFSKLEANDLSMDEALAMLSAVHNELGQRAVSDSKVYQSYAGFMKLLQHEKPDVYDYVVSSWNQRIKTNSSEENDGDTNIGESVTTDSNLRGIEANSEKGVGNVIVTEGEPIEKEEPQEPGEVEEKETNPLETIEKIGGEQESEKVDEEEPEEEESDQEDIKSEEPVESDDDKVDDLVDETETDEPQEEEKEPSEEEAEPDDNETESEGEAATNEVNDESEAGSEKGGTEGEAGFEQEETEWPEIEQSQSDDLFDGLEEEDDPFQGED